MMMKKMIFGNMMIFLWITRNKKLMMIHKKKLRMMWIKMKLMKIKMNTMRGFSMKNRTPNRVSLEKIKK